MPKYLYRCTECGVEEMLYHSMDDRIDDCAKCGHSDTMMKIPTKFNLANKKDNKRATGAVVKDSIEEFKEDLRDQKREMSNQNYGNKN